MKDIIQSFRVKVNYIYVSKIRGDNRGNYNFDYYIYSGKKKLDYGNLDGTFTGRSASAFRKCLNRGYAIHLVMQRHFS